MRNLIILGLMAAAVLPSAASAQSRGEVRHDRRELREEKQELRHARRYGDRRDVREERRDVREAREELGEDLRDYRRWNRNNWRDWRTSNRGTFSRGYWRSPYRYQRFQPGWRISSGYYGGHHMIQDPWRYRLPPVRGAYRWVRHYDDVLLVDMRRGMVVDVMRGFFW